MPADLSLIDHLRELFQPLGSFSARAMFGAWGIYLDGIIVGLLDEGTCYLKTDAESERLFAEAGSVQFTYPSKDGPVRMSYWSLPEDALDSTEALAPWVRLAQAAALRKRTASKSRRARSESSPPRKPRRRGAGKATH